MSTWEERMAARAYERSIEQSRQWARDELAELAKQPGSHTEEEYLAYAEQEWREHDGMWQSFPCACMGPPPNVVTTKCRCQLSSEAALRAGKVPSDG